jgi:uncharacterized membrane protein YoaK (UPF0700 family)
VSGTTQDIAPQEVRITSVSVRLGSLLAVAGGFLDAYTYVSRHGVFATSQTGNLVLFCIRGTRGDWAQAIRHLPPLAAFICGVMAAETLKRPRVVRWIRWPARAAIVVEIAVLAIVGTLPASAPDSLVTVMVAFVASIQVSMFRTLVKWPYNTTMTTGNLRTAFQALYLAVVDRNADAAAQARSFLTVIFAFLVGALLGGYVTFEVGGRAVWLACLILCLCLVVFAVDDTIDRRKRLTPPGVEAP